MNQELGIFDILVGFVLMIAFFTFAFCMASLRGHVDEEKLREEKSAASVVASPIPPERVLTDTGLFRAKLAKICIGIVFACVAIIVVRNNL